MGSQILGTVENSSRRAREISVPVAVLILGGAAVGTYVGFQIGGPMGAAVGALVGAFVGALAAGLIKGLKVRISADGTVEAQYETIFS